MVRIGKYGLVMIMALVLCSMLVSAAFAGGYVATCSFTGTTGVNIYNVSGSGTAIGTLVQSFTAFTPASACWFASNGDFYEVAAAGPYCFIKYPYLGNGQWGATNWAINTQIGPDVRPFMVGFGMAIDSAGNLYSGVTDPSGATANDWIYKGIVGGTATQWAQVPTANGGTLFFDMRLSPDGSTLWTSEQLDTDPNVPFPIAGNGIQSVNLSTGVQGVVAGAGTEYRGFDFGPNGNIYAGNSNNVDILNPTTGALISHFIVSSPHLEYINSLAFGPDYNGDGVRDLYVGCINADHPGIDVFSGANGAWLGHINDPNRTWNVATWTAPLEVKVTLSYLDPTADLSLMNVRVKVLDSSGNVVQNVVVNAAPATGSPKILTVDLGVPTGSYQVRVTGPGWLTKQVPAVVGTGGAVVYAPLLSGDINGDNFVEDQDYSILGTSWYQTAD